MNEKDMIFLLKFSTGTLYLYYVPSCTVYLVLSTWVIWIVEKLDCMFMEILSYIPYVKLQNCHELSGKR
jgi:hypothetical protein